jgi:hypothetical protein
MWSRRSRPPRLSPLQPGRYAARRGVSPRAGTVVLIILALVGAWLLGLLSPVSTGLAVLGMLMLLLRAVRAQS